MLLLAGFTLPTRAAFLPIFGGPGYVAGVGGYQSGFPNPTAINDAGVAVGHEFKLSATNSNEGYRAVRWDATGASDALHELGSGSASDIGTPLTDGIPPAINAAGVVVGSAYKYDASGTSKGSRAVRWDAAGNAIELEHLGTNASGATSGEARAINAAGIAAGRVDKYDATGVNKGSRVVRWDANGTIHELAPLSAKSDGFSNNEAYAMNSNNLVVGYGVRYDASDAVKGTRAVRWDAAGAAQELTVNFGSSVTGVSQSRATALNDAGVAVGYAEKYSTFGGFQGERAVRWDGGGVGLELGNLGTSTSGTAFSHANDINAAGIMVGYADKYDAAGNSKGQRAVRWDASGGVHELGTLGMRADGSSVGEAYRLNSAGIAVGYARRYAADGTELNDTAVYWEQSGTVIELNSLIDPASGWSLNYANSITDTGWIGGIGSFDPDGVGPEKRYFRVFSMQVPAAAAPEPGALGLLSVSLVSCLAHRRPRRCS